MAERKWVEWSPPKAPWVKGRYTERTFDADGLPEEQEVEVRCEHPGCDSPGVWRRRCSSGQVRGHIATYALVHAHRDALAAPRVDHPDSLRRRDDG